MNSDFLDGINKKCASGTSFLRNRFLVTTVTYSQEQHICLLTKGHSCPTSAGFRKTVENWVQENNLKVGVKMTPECTICNLF